MKVGIIGAGAWGCALGYACARGGADTTAWSFSGVATEFDGVVRPENMQITRDFADVASADVWLVATPAAFFADTMRAAGVVYTGCPIIICTKGMDANTGEFMSEILARIVPACGDVGVLSGPQFAAEVARGVKTGSALMGTDASRRACVAALPEFVIEQGTDIIGAQVCGVGKNALALIAGYNSVACDGENTRALYFSGAWGDVINVGLACGADIGTFSGLAGVGDLFLTATSMTSRNFTAGAAIARGDVPDGTVEGISAIRGLMRRAARVGVATPYLGEMCDKLRLGRN